MTYNRVNPRPLIRVDIRSGDKGRLKVVWDDGERRYDPYQIDEDMVVQEASVIRRKLSALVRVSMTDPPGQYGPLIKDIARAGKELYDALFFDAGPSEQDVEVVRDWFSGLQGSRRVSFVVDGFIHVPWHLIYDGDPEQLPDDEAAPDTYESFWCLKYLVSCMYRGNTPYSDSDVRNPSKFRLLPVLHKDAFEVALAYMPVDEQQALSGLFNQFGKAIHGRRELIDAWQLAGNLNRILFFFCHANGTTLALNQDDAISVNDFKKRFAFSKAGKGAVALTFLNGCSTAVGLETQGFIEATSRPGHCGFVGTETEIPNVYALRYGNAFLQCLLETGWPLVEVMDAMRRLHWPLSLIYGLYGYAGFKIDRQPEATVWPIGPNFSRGPIGAAPL
jgi:hypothetical protein